MHPNVRPVDGAPAMDQAGTMLARFRSLDRALRDHESLWTFQPFTHLRLPWERQYPALTRWLRGLDGDAIGALEANPEALGAALSSYLPGALAVRDLGLVAPLAADPAPLALPRDIDHRIPGRKWQQILAFAACLAPSPQPYLEWCAGKGHLGRLLGSRDGQPVESLEIRPELCEAGGQLARRLGIPQRLHPVDVLGEAACGHLRPAQHAVALHACGELHLRLLREASSVGVARLSVSPCCYNLIPDPIYRPLSGPARESELRLEQRHLRLPLQETVTAGQRVRRLRDREVDWRLGADLLQREISGVDVYRSLPHFPKRLLNGRFEDFCRLAAARWELDLPTGVDYVRFEAAGRERRLDVSRMELVRHLFRRPLEIWLVLDRALYLTEQGYRVSLGTFCEHRLTPRNLLIQAERAD